MSSTVSCSSAAQSVSVSSRIPAQIWATPTGWVMNSSPERRSWSAWRSQANSKACSIAARSIVATASAVSPPATAVARSARSRTPRPRRRGRRGARCALRLFASFEVSLALLDSGRCRRGTRPSAPVRSPLRIRPRRCRRRRRGCPARGRARRAPGSSAPPPRARAGAGPRRAAPPAAPRRLPRRRRAGPGRRRPAPGAAPAARRGREREKRRSASPQARCRKPPSSLTARSERPPDGRTAAGRRGRRGRSRRASSGCRSQLGEARPARSRRRHRCPQRPRRRPRRGRSRRWRPARRRPRRAALALVAAAGAAGALPARPARRPLVEIGSPARPRSAPTIAPALRRARRCLARVELAQHHPRLDRAVPVVHLEPHRGVDRIVVADPEAASGRRRRRAPDGRRCGG